MDVIAYLAAVLFVLGIGQLYAGAGGISRTCVRVGQWLCSIGSILFTVAVVF